MDIRPWELYSPSWLSSMNEHIERKDDHVQKFKCDQKT